MVITLPLGQFPHFHDWLLIGLGTTFVRLGSWLLKLGATEVHGDG